VWPTNMGFHRPARQSFERPFRANRDNRHQCLQNNVATPQKNPMRLYAWSVPRDSHGQMAFIAPHLFALELVCAVALPVVARLVSDWHCNIPSSGSIASLRSSSPMSSSRHCSMQSSAPPPSRMRRSPKSTETWPSGTRSPVCRAEWPLTQPCHGIGARGTQSLALRSFRPEVRQSRNHSNGKACGVCV
jgi:hypothetical protein